MGSAGWKFRNRPDPAPRVRQAAFYVASAVSCLSPHTRQLCRSLLSIHRRVRTQISCTGHEFPVKNRVLDRSIRWAVGFIQYHFDAMNPCNHWSYVSWTSPPPMHWLIEFGRGSVAYQVSNPELFVVIYWLQADEAQTYRSLSKLHRG